MGSGNTKVLDQTDKKVVLVVGGGFGGIEVAKAVEKKTNCALVDRKDYFFHNVGALRGVVEEGFENKICIPYNRLLTSGSVVKGDVTEITTTHIQIHGHENEIKFDYLVIATGTSYAFPAKVPLDRSSDVAQLFAKVREEVSAAKRIVIVGGGPVGVELAGEIIFDKKNMENKDKKVTIITSGKSLVSNREDLNEKLGASLEKQLVEGGVELCFEERVDFSSFEGDAWKERYLVGPVKFSTEKGREVEADLVFFCHGSHINCGAYEKNFKDSMSDRGELRVNKFLQVEGHENIFAIGDCCNADQKMGFLAAEQGALVASNIIAHIEGKSLKQHQKGIQAMIVPLGAYKGASQLPLFGVVGATATSLLKGRDLFVNKTWKALKHSGPPSSGEGGEGREEENEEEKKKNLMAALGCEEEGVEQVQKGLLPVRELGEDETHL